MCKCSAVSKTPFSSNANGSHTLFSTQSTIITEKQGKVGCDTFVLFGGLAFHSLFFSALRPRVGVCVNYHLFQIETSQVRIERFVNLW